MKTIRTIRLRRLQGALGQVVDELTKTRFCELRAPETAWQPAVNAYRCGHFIRMCFDLAGVERTEIDLRIEPGRLVIRGHRELPEPPEVRDCARDESGLLSQVLAMEIDHGLFQREVALPLNVDGDRVTAEQKNGLLWVYLPLQPHA